MSLRDINQGSAARTEVLADGQCALPNRQFKRTAQRDRPYRGQWIADLKFEISNQMGRPLRGFDQGGAAGASALPMRPT